MKKLNLLIVVALLASALLMAASPAKLVRLTVYNQTDAPIYIKLEGELTGSFYYLTVPADATRENDGGITFTILTDKYTRTTWACDYQTSGELIMTGNVRLNFVPCNTMPKRTVGFWTDPVTLITYRVWTINKGEPTMEKVSYFKYYTGDYWTYNCGEWIVASVTFKTPTGCFFRYRY